MKYVSFYGNGEQKRYGGNLLKSIAHCVRYAILTKIAASIFVRELRSKSRYALFIDFIFVIKIYSVITLYQFQ